MRKLASIQIIVEKKPIQGDDMIEAARVNGWWVVVKKDEFKVGEKVIYFEVDSFLPVREPFLFLLKGKTPKKMLIEGGQTVEGIVLKTIKLKGQISQGLIMPALQSYDEGTDVTVAMGILKYEPPIAPELSGNAKGNFPGFIPKTDEERIQNMLWVLEQYYVTEKLDGISVTFYKKDSIFGVCSRNFELLDNNGTQWKLARKYNLPEILPDNTALQGEIIGEGIQGNPLRQVRQDVYFYSAYDIMRGEYKCFNGFIGICTQLKVKTVPIISTDYHLPDSLDELMGLANYNSELAPFPREGIVIRHKRRTNYKDGDSFKVISNNYLLNQKD